MKVNVNSTCAMAGGKVTKVLEGEEGVLLKRVAQRL